MALPTPHSLATPMRDITAAIYVGGRPSPNCNRKGKCSKQEQGNTKLSRTSARARAGVKCSRKKERSKMAPGDTARAAHARSARCASVIKDWKVSWFETPFCDLFSFFFSIFLFSLSSGCLASSWKVPGSNPGNVASFLFFCFPFSFLFSFFLLKY